MLRMINEIVPVLYNKLRSNHYPVYDHPDGYIVQWWYHIFGVICES